MILLERVSRRTGENRYAVRDLSFEVLTGENLVLVGSSGSGKTTTLKMINRLLRPTAGRILIDGKDNALESEVTLRRGIGYVFQDVGLFPHMSASENISLLPRLIGWSDSLIRRTVDELMQMVRLPVSVYGNRMPHELSGGEKQRIGLARALALRPRVMLLDEPFGALDPVTREVLREEFMDLRKSLGLTTVLVTHDMTEALIMGDRIGVLQEGRLIALGSPGELLSGAGHPAADRLLESPKRTARILDRLTGGNT